MGESKIVVSTLTSESEISIFRELVEQINPNNPFYKPELILAKRKPGTCPNFFIYYTNEQPTVLMCINLSRISIKNELTEYKDASSPYGYSGPIFNPDTTLSTLIDFWQLVDDWYSKNKVVTEFIRFSLTQNQLGYSGITIPTLNNVCGKIIPDENQWINFKPKVRNNFRKASKEGLMFRIYYKDIPKEVVSKFHSIYIDTMKRNQATEYYFFPVEYFMNYLENNPSNAAIAVVYYENLPISVEFLLLSNETVFSFLGGTVSEYFYTRPNDFLKINVLDWARKKGKELYVLGGGRTNNDALYKYKKNFFPKDNDLIYYTGRKIILPEIYKEFMLQTAVSKDEIPSTIESGFFPFYRRSI